MPSDDRDLRIKRVQCGMCDETFTDGTIPELAGQIADHWNYEHDDDLRLDETEFDREVHVGHHLHGDEYSARVYRYYITAYDVIDADGDRPFKYQYVREPEAAEHCEDCWRSIEAVDGYSELDSPGWRDRYLCDECRRQRRIERRKQENEQLTEFNA